ncbi:hypothetical protein FRB90_001661, partial [Tulasnella sp. 427]
MVDSSLVSYCSPPSAILIQQFDASYFKSNSSLVFGIAASTTLSSLNVTATVELSADGMDPVDTSFNLCDAGGQALCPLSTSNFSGTATVPMPEVQEKIQHATWVLPDSDATLKLQLVQADTNETLLCVQSTLSNGHTASQPAVSWLIGILLIFTFLLSTIFTFVDVFLRPTLPSIPYPLLPSSLSAFAPHPRTYISTTPLLYRWLTLLWFLQHVVLSAVLDLDYPGLYRSWALNFAWSLGLFPQDPEGALQKSIFNLRRRTGSNVTSADEAALVPLGYSSGSDSLSGGLEAYSSRLGIAQSNAFVSLFYVLLFVFLIGSAVAGLGYALVTLIEWVWLPYQRKDRNGWARKKRYLDGVKVVSGRVLLALLAPAFTLVLFQWTLGDSWLAVLLSVLTLAVLCTALIYPTYTLIQVQRHHTWAKSTSLLPYSLKFLTEPWATHRWYTTVACFAPTMVLKAAFAALGRSSSGLVQVVAFVVLDTLSLAFLLTLRPGNSRSSDALEIFVAAVRLVTSACLVAFVRTVHVRRTAVGIVLMTLESLVLVVLLVGVVRNVVALVVAGVKRRLVDGRWGLVDGSESDEGDGGDEEKVVRGMTMATTATTSTGLASPAHWQPGGNVTHEYTSGRSTPTDTRSIVPASLAKEIIVEADSSTNFDSRQDPAYTYGYAESVAVPSMSVDLVEMQTKPETIYPKS